ncbi:MAG: hypothetical protein ABW061_27005 [Polyangiaceae bacterium]
MAAKSLRALGFCLLTGLWVVLAVGCGYQPLYAHPAGEHLAVQVGQVMIPEPLAAQSVASGARAELSAAGMLARGSDAPRLVLDVLRVDESSRGIHVQPGGGQPAASGMSVAVTARGRVFRAGASDPELDTGDLRRAVQVAGDADPRADSAAYDEALRDAAERTGRAVARAALGIPEPVDEAP